MATKKSAAKKTTARKTTAKTTAKKSEAETPEAAVQTTDGTSEVTIVPAGGIDPRLVERRDAQREVERGVRPAHAAEPASLDPKLAEIREQTIKRESELANRSLRKTPERA